MRPPRLSARLGLERASTVPDLGVRGSGGTAQRLLFVLVQIVHVEIAMLLEPVLVGLDRQCPHQPQAALRISPLRTDSLPLVSKIYWPQNADDAIMGAP